MQPRRHLLSAMQHLMLPLLALVLSLASSFVLAAGPRIQIETSMGNIVVELNQDKAPKTVANFLRYAEEKFYDKTIFHRVINNFMIQGGGMEASLAEKPTHTPIQNEADNGLKNLRGTIAMARTPDPHSATAQFFINVVDNESLDYRGNARPGDWGYCVFGKVVEGMDVVDKIKVVETRTVGRNQDVPVSPVVIKSVQLLPGKK